MNKPLRALITNDDGIASEGLRQLAMLAVEAGLEVIVAAPNVDFSGCGTSLSAVHSDGGVAAQETALKGLEGVPSFAVGGTPAFIALIAVRGAFGDPPDVVLSGINLGQNVGRSIIHSGTVGGAVTGAAHGCRALAASAAGFPPHWDTAVEVVRRVLPTLLASPPGTVVNLNAPDVALGLWRGFRRAGLASFGAVQTRVAEFGSGYMQMETVSVDGTPEAGTDSALLAEGWATWTPLQSTFADRSSEFSLNDGLAQQKARSE